MLKAAPSLRSAHAFRLEAIRAIAAPAPSDELIDKLRAGSSRKCRMIDAQNHSAQASRSQTIPHFYLTAGLQS